MNSSYTTCTQSEISVIIPTYYRQYNLSELFDSILRQTITPIEVIVVDDHTPNDTIKKVCEEYELKFEKINIDLKYIRNPRERSAAIARNVGIENSTGEIILFLDSDMILYPEFIEKTLEVFKNNPNALGVQGWIITNIEYNKTVYYLKNLFNSIFYLDKYSKNSCKYKTYPSMLTKIINCTTMHGGCMAFKRNILNEFRFDENLKKYSFHEDVLLSHSIFQKYPNSLFITPYAKIIHKHSKSGRMIDKDLKEHKNNCRKYVLTKLFGFKGLLIYYRQNIGLSIIRIFRRYLVGFVN